MAQDMRQHSRRRFLIPREDIENSVFQTNAEIIHDTVFPFEPYRLRGEVNNDFRCLWWGRIVRLNTPNISFPRFCIRVMLILVRFGEYDHTSGL